MYGEYLTPVAIAINALFSGVSTGSAHAQEPTPPPEGGTGIGVYCDKEASCFITEGTQNGIYPDTGTVANTVVGFGLIDPDQAEACADAFENEHSAYLKPDPAGGRRQFQFSGMQFDLPGECTKNLFNEVQGDRTGKPATLLSGEGTPGNHEPLQKTVPKIWDCLGSIGIFVGLGGAWHLSINQRYRKKA